MEHKGSTFPWRIVFMIGGILVLSGFLTYLLVFYDAGPIPKKYKQGLNFSLYYPESLPARYSVDQTSFKREGDVLIFSIKNNGGKNIAVSQQALPSEGVAHQENNAPLSIPGERVFTTSIGQVHLGLWGDKYVADIVTPKTWVILNVTGLTADQATAVAKTFREL
jgi:hypothetical protein